MANRTASKPNIPFPSGHEHRCKGFQASQRWLSGCASASLVGPVVKELLRLSPLKPRLGPLMHLWQLLGKYVGTPKVALEERQERGLGRERKVALGLSVSFPL